MKGRLILSISLDRHNIFRQFNMDHKISCICYALLHLIQNFLTLTQIKLCMVQANGDQAEHPTTTLQTLQHLATRTHRPS